MSYKYLGLEYGGDILATASMKGEVLAKPEEIEKICRLGRLI
jgi:hypothetical protein